MARSFRRVANHLPARPPPLVVLDPPLAPDPALLPLVALGPARQPKLAVVQRRRLPGLGIDPVGDHVDMGMLGVLMGDDQRLVALQTQRLQTPVHRPAHLPLAGRFVLCPAERVVQDRLRQLAPRPRNARQPLEVGGRLCGRGHQPRRTLRPERREVPGVGPPDPLRCPRAAVVRLGGIVEAVRRGPGERPPQPVDLRDHRSNASPLRRPAASSPTRSTASSVPEGAEAPEFRARAIWFRLTPIRWSSTRSWVPSR